MSALLLCCSAVRIPRGLPSAIFQHILTSVPEANASQTTLEAATVAMLVASKQDPDIYQNSRYVTPYEGLTLFVQSHVPSHTKLPALIRLGWQQDTVYPVLAHADVVNTYVAASQRHHAVWAPALHVCLEQCPANCSVDAWAEWANGMESGG